MRGKIAPYFEETCCDELDYFMRKNWFSKCIVQEHGGVIFYRKSFFIEITYYPEDNPKYFPMVNIGMVDGSGSRRLLGLWSVIPDTDKDRNYSQLSFSSESQLRLVLRKLSNGVITRFAFPLCEDSERFEHILCVKEESRKLDFEGSMQKTLKRQAKEAFQNGRYREAVKLYEEIPLDNLSALEFKRLDFAKSHL